MSRQDFALFLGAERKNGLPTFYFFCKKFRSHHVRWANEKKGLTVLFPSGIRERRVSSAKIMGNYEMPKEGLLNPRGPKKRRRKKTFSIIRKSFVPILGTIVIFCISSSRDFEIFLKVLFVFGHDFECTPKHQQTLPKRIFILSIVGSCLGAMQNPLQL